ncbi:ABC transporter substrate-binding protein [Actinophytocola gossypii]|uniref:ABC transporter substrate-binding protein n=1 Tax=Actinophytocola gossypii TaxID=2812003 RepID=A0ABT2JAR3_9PSEU|nr:ABC transporter substrate-binding protein [Actinophytocola gossypii]MCT2584379.1 ABC transporter substrate-binding protein [Actinophytocola gossypii]
MAQRVLVRAAGLAACLAVLATGCADPYAAPDRSGEGVTVTSCGRELSFPATPERAVTLDQTATETLLELGLAERMAGTSNLKVPIAPEYAADYDTVPVLSEKLLTAEQLRAAAPDVVLASFAAQYTPDRVGTREELAELGLPTFVSAVDCPRHHENRTAFDRLFADYETIGRIFGVEDRAATLVDEQRAAVTRAERAGENSAGEPTVLWLYSTFNGIPYVAGGTGLPAELSRIVGARNAFDDVDEDWPEVSWERIAERDPDVIVVGDLSERGAPGDSAEEKIAMMKEHPVVSQLRAVRENRIIEVPGIAMDPSVRSVDALGLVVDGLRDLGHVR